MWGFKPKTTPINALDILDILWPYVANPNNVFFNDRDYLVPDDPEFVMKKVPSHRYSYDKKKCDCDDFVRIFRGWLSQKGWGNLLAMDCIIQTSSGDHNLIAFILHGKIIFGEPQTGKIVQHDNYKILRIVA